MTKNNAVYRLFFAVWVINASTTSPHRPNGSNY